MIFFKIERNYNDSFRKMVLKVVHFIYPFSNLNVHVKTNYVNNFELTKKKVGRLGKYK